MTNPNPMGGGMNSASVRLDAISQAWGIVQKNIATWVVSALIYGAIVGVIAILQGAVGPKAGANGTVSGGAPLVGFMLSILSFIVSSFLLGGLYRMALKELRGGTASPGEIFGATDILPALLGGSLLVGLVTGIGFLLCVLPGLYIAPLLFLTTVIIADNRAGAVDALTQSYNALKGQWLNAFLFGLVLGIINFVGALLCGLGLLVTIPISIVAVAVVYNDFFGNGSGAFNNANSSLYPPIPNIPQ